MTVLFEFKEVLIQKFSEKRGKIQLSSIVDVSLPYFKLYRGSLSQNSNFRRKISTVDRSRGHRYCILFYEIKGFRRVNFEYMVEVKSITFQIIKVI